MKKITAGFILMCLFFGPSVFSQSSTASMGPRVEIPGSHVRKINSDIVKQEYELQILLPGSYATSDKKYPVLYLMDSQWDFPLLKSLYGQQYYDGFIPEMIIVGVTWGGYKPNPDSLRARDYTPTNESRVPQSGGAANFLAFMKKELIPFIETNYKADNRDRVLMGCSLGGLVTLYALFTEPELFQGYVAASPAFGWDREGIYSFEKKYFESNSKTKARLYMTMGGVERSVPGFEKLSKYMADRKYPSLQFQAKVLDNTGHSGTKGEGFARGLQYVYERPALKLGTEVIAQYAGTYSTPNGNKIELKNENEGLVIYAGNNKNVLLAASETEFYLKSEFFKMVFKKENDKVTGFQFDRYGSSQFMSKKL